jgi:hypothetical protein
VSRDLDEADFASALAHPVGGQALRRGGQFIAFGYQAVQGRKTAAFRGLQSFHFFALPPLSTCGVDAVPGQRRS